MEAVIKTKSITKDTFNAISEAMKHEANKGTTSKGYKFIKTFSKLIIF